VERGEKLKRGKGGSCRKERSNVQPTGMLHHIKRRIQSAAAKKRGTTPAGKKSAERKSSGPENTEAKEKWEPH